VPPPAARPAAKEPAAAPAPTTPESAPVGPLSLAQLRDSWPEILEVVQSAKLNAWIVLQTAQARALDDDVLTVSFVSEVDANNFKQPNPGGDSVSEHLRSAILKVLGVRVKFRARVEAAPVADAAPEPTEPAVEPGGWAVASIPASEPEPAPRISRAPTKPVAEASTPENSRYGESVVRELLGASFIEEQKVAPRVTPQAGD